MGRIRHTLELALERAAAEAGTSSDVETHAHREMVTRVSALVERFLDDMMFGPERLESFLSRYRGPMQAAARDRLCARLLGAVRPDTWSRAMAGLVALCHRVDRAHEPVIWENLEKLQRETEAVVEQRLADLAATEASRARQALERSGIRGSAVLVAPLRGEMKRLAVQEAENALGQAWEAVRQRILETLRSIEGGTE